MAKDGLDALISAGYLVSLGTAAIVGIPVLIILDIFVAITLYAISKNIMVFPIAVFEALPGTQIIPTWTAFVMLNQSKFGGTN